MERKDVIPAFLQTSGEARPADGQGQPEHGLPGRPLHWGSQGRCLETELQRKHDSKSDSLAPALSPFQTETRKTTKPERGRQPRGIHTPQLLLLG